MNDDEKDRRVAILISASRAVLEMFRSGFNPTERQLALLDGAIANLTALKTCGGNNIVDNSIRAG